MRADEPCGEGTAVVDDGFVADASMMVLPADIDPGARRRAARACLGISKNDLKVNKVIVMVS